MMISIVESGGLTGTIEYYEPGNSYVMRILHGEKVFIAVGYGNGVLAEDVMLEFLEHPEWTLLQYG